MHHRSLSEAERDADIAAPSRTIPIRFDLRASLVPLRYRFLLSWPPTRVRFRRLPVTLSHVLISMRSLALS